MTQVPALDTRTAAAVRLLAEAQASLDSDLGQARACLGQLATLLSDQPGGAERPMETTTAPRRGGLAPWQVRRVTAYVNEHFNEPVSVSDLAAVARLSGGHFCRAFKASIGTTPHTFIVRRRLEHAQFLMLTTPETLSRIAATCGLTDQAHLTRLFRRHVGQTPLAWRRTWRQAA